MQHDDLSKEMRFYLCLQDARVKRANLELISIIRRSSVPYLNVTQSIANKFIQATTDRVVYAWAHTHSIRAEIAARVQKPKRIET